MVPLCRLISASCGEAPRSSSACGSSSSQIGSSAGKYRRFSSNRSNTDVIQRSPNQTRGRTPCCFSSSGRVSVACSNSVILVSCHSCRPNRNGELAARDRKSTRLNSSHLVISYAVFCLKKKKKKILITRTQYIV